MRKASLDRLAASAVMACCAVGMLGAQDPAGGTSRYRAITGTYTNFSYRYEVRVPPGLVGQATRPPAPDHGVHIPLSKSSEIDMDASYDSMLYGSAAKALDAHVATFWEGCSPATRRLVDEREISLGGLTALRRRVECEGSNAAGTRVLDEVLALHSEPSKSEIGVVYSIQLSADGSSYEESKRILDEVVASFKLVP